MEEERRMILRMLEEGKISANQAAELLSALEEGRLDLSEPERKKSDDIGDRVETVINDTAERIPVLVEKFLENFSIGGLFGLGQYHFEEKFEGEILSDVFEVDLNAFNGRIELETWDKPHYEIVVKKTVKAGDEKTAKVQAANMVERRVDGEKLKVSLARNDAAGGSITGYLPANKLYIINLNTSNGRIEVRGVNAKEVSLNTSTGRVVFSGRAEKGTLSTSNGRVVFKGIRNVKARTSNGRIVAMTPLEGLSDWDLKTSNGSINVQSDSETGYDIAAKTSLGKIELDLRGLQYEKDEMHKPGRAEVIAKTEDYDSRARKVCIRAITTNGSIRFNSSVSEED